MKFGGHKVFIGALLLLCMQSLSSCQQKQGKQHLIISEQMQKLSESGLQTDLFLHPNDYQVAYTCLFDGRMTFENLQLELSLHNQQNALIQRDTLDFKLAKREGIWIDAQPLVHEAKANKALSYQIPFAAIYHFKFRLLNEIHPDGILGLSLEIETKD